MVLKNFFAVAALFLTGIAIIAGTLPPACLCADNQLMNIQPRKPAAPAFQPGAVIQFPDGRRGVIEQALPNGDFQTNLGIVITPEGALRGNPDAGNAILIEAPEMTQSVTIGGASQAPAQETPAVAPETSVNIPETPGATGVAVVPEAVQPAPENPANQEEAPSITAILPKTEPAPKVESPKAEPGATAIQTPRTETPKAQTPEQLTLAQLIPLTNADEKSAPKKQEGATREPVKEKAKTPEKKPETPQKKAEPAQAKKPQKPAVGEELRIPPEAAKTGNLDFLEGCWQGTRPEYYSKRIIKECFCFGAKGQNGKRRVIDPQGHRMCIGGTRASLSSSGVLSVTSQGAACDDGERWGSAEMICKNSGPKTPCSWVFRDANNGRQSYTIPFVRVESCGR